MLALRWLSRISLRVQKTHLPSISVLVIARDHTHSSSPTAFIHTLAKEKPLDTLINHAVNKDVAGILNELENIHSSVAAVTTPNQASTTECEPELAALAANLFFNEKVSEDNVASIDQCCDIFDLLAEKHPVLAQQGYSKLLEVSLAKDRLLLVTRICTRLLAQDVRLTKPFYDSLVIYLTTCGQVDQALAIARAVPLTKHIMFALVEPLFLSGRHMAFAELFQAYCSPFNSEAWVVADLNLVVASMIWAKGLRQPSTQADREVFVGSIVRSLESYKELFESKCFASDKISRSEALRVKKTFYAMKDVLEHVFLSSEEADREGTADAVTNLRRKFVTSRYFTPFPFMSQDCAVSTNFPSLVQDITSQMEDLRVRGSGLVLGEERSPFFLTNSFWGQDYGDMISELVEEKEEDPYHDGDSGSDSDNSDSDSDSDSNSDRKSDSKNDSDSDSDSDSNFESDSDSESEESGKVMNNSDDEDSDDSSNEDSVKYTISFNVNAKKYGRNVALKDHAAPFSLPIPRSRLHKRVDMGAHLDRGWEDLWHFRHPPQSEQSRSDQMSAFVNDFQIEQKINTLMNTSAAFSPQQAEHEHGHASDSGRPCPRKVMICAMMDNLGSSAGHVNLSRIPDISSQCREKSNIRLANDLFGAEAHYHLTESVYDSLVFMRDEVSWGKWER